MPLVWHDCACNGKSCDCYTLGPNIEVNENALRRVFNVGGRIRLAEMLARCDSDATGALPVGIGFTCGIMLLTSGFGIAQCVDA